MAMLRPAPKRISSHSIAAFRAGGHIHRVLAQVEIALLILQIAPHPVQMNRMRHHGVVYQHDPHTLAIIETQRLGIVESDSVKRPRETVHMPGQAPPHASARSTPNRVWEPTTQIR